MKKILIFIAISLLAVTHIDAQISKTKTKELASLQFGHRKLCYSVHENNDTIYFCSLTSNNEFHGRVIILLGNKNKAILTLQSLYDYMISEEQDNDDIISLNNLSNNKAIASTLLGQKYLQIFAEHSSKIYGTIDLKQIKKFISILDNTHNKKSYQDPKDFNDEDS